MHGKLMAEILIQEPALQIINPNYSSGKKKKIFWSTESLGSRSFGAVVKYASPISVWNKGTSQVFISHTARDS